MVIKPVKKENYPALFETFIYPDKFDNFYSIEDGENIAIFGIDENSFSYVSDKKHYYVSFYDGVINYIYDGENTYSYSLSNDNFYVNKNSDNENINRQLYIDKNDLGLELHYLVSWSNRTCDYTYFINSLDTLISYILYINRHYPDIIEDTYTLYLFGHKINITDSYVMNGDNYLKLNHPFFKMDIKTFLEKMKKTNSYPIEQDMIDICSGVKITEVEKTYRLIKKYSED